ncbi:hypothetical protein [Leptolyngbya sp. FACHB-261]|uniref:hypothetical protein n=1 Tax=Leptolyngbya sp. FACHB-261 TaxID=2692806 RepID=UPI001684AEA4|nr:hypothetical protein [Leptolyngbya sp. FACHB-261]MBD2103854.1 hypothetical protein [Leptolyngbya sp. FACHB-261]
MALTNYRVETLNGFNFISLKGGTTTESGSALTTFAGPAGQYDLVLGYFDEDDRTFAQLEVKLNGVSLAQWTLTQKLGLISVVSKNLVRRTVGVNLSLAPGDRIEIIGRESPDEPARVDYLQFIPVL